MLNDFLASQAEGNTAEDWLISLAIIVGGVLVSKIAYFISTKGLKKLAEKARGRFLYILVDMIEEPFAIAIVIAGFYWAEQRLNLSKGFDAAFGKVIGFAVILDLTWLIARLLDELVDAYLVPRVEASDSKLDDQLLPIVRKGGKILIWAIGIVGAIESVGYNVGTIVAGLGIGGLAFAFAAQETIANLFGGVTIFVDAPFVIGDRIKVGGFDGWVREIGIRTAKLETLDGRRLTVPNAFFSKSVIENVSSEPATKVVETVGVSPLAGAAEMEKAIGILREIIAGEEGLEKNSTAFFSDFGPSSYDISFVLWIRKGADYGETRSRVNLAVLRRFGEAGVELSVPTRLLVNKS